MLEQITTPDEIPTGKWQVDETIPIHNWEIDFSSLYIQATSNNGKLWDVRFQDHALDAWLYGSHESMKLQVLQRLKDHVELIQGYIEAMESA